MILCLIQYILVFAQLVETPFLLHSWWLLEASLLDTKGDTLLRLLRMLPCCGPVSRQQSRSSCAGARRQVVAVIHQPRYDTLQLFDDLVL